MTLRAAVVSRELGKKFDRSTTESTAIRGWNNTYAGFKCQQETEESVRVRWEFGDRYSDRMLTLKEREQLTREHCQAMQAHLSSAGGGNLFNPQLYDTDTYFGKSESYLIVTRKVIE